MTFQSVNLNCKQYWFTEIESICIKKNVGWAQPSGKGELPFTIVTCDLHETVWEPTRKNKKCDKCIIIISNNNKY